MLQSQWMFRMWVMKKGSQQMMNTPRGEHGGQAGLQARGRLGRAGLRSVGIQIGSYRPRAQEHCRRSPVSDSRTVTDTRCQ